MVMATTGLTPQRAPVQRLDFGDRDLTDTFADVHDDSLSSSGAGHPRGDSPISGLTSSRRSTPSNAFAAAVANNVSSPGTSFVSPSKPLPNLTALLAFLDSDTTVPHHPHRGGGDEDGGENERSRRSPSLLRSPPSSSRKDASFSRRGGRQQDEEKTPLSQRRQPGSAADRMAAALMEGAPPGRWDGEKAGGAGGGGLKPPATAPPAPGGRILHWQDHEEEERRRQPPHMSYDPRVGARARASAGMARTSDLPQSLLDEVQQEFHELVSRPSSNPRPAAVDTGLSTASTSFANDRPDDASNEEDDHELSRALTDARTEVAQLQTQVESLKALVRRLAGTGASSRVTPQSKTDEDPDATRRFVRTVDGLVYRPLGPSGRRRDEDVFDEANLSLLADRVAAWSALSRWTPTSSRQRRRAS